MTHDEGCQRPDEVPLHLPTQETGAEVGVVAVRDEPVEHVGIYLDADVATGEALPIEEPGQFALGNGADGHPRKRVKVDHTIETVEKLEPKNLKDSPVQLRVERAHVTRVRKPEYGVPEDLGASVARRDENMAACCAAGVTDGSSTGMVTNHSPRSGVKSTSVPNSRRNASPRKGRALAAQKRRSIGSQS